MVDLEWKRRRVASWIIQDYSGTRKGLIRSLIFYMRFLCHYKRLPDISLYFTLYFTVFYTIKEIILMLVHHNHHINLLAAGRLGECKRRF